MNRFMLQNERDAAKTKTLAVDELMIQIEEFLSNPENKSPAVARALAVRARAAAAELTDAISGASAPLAAAYLQDRIVLDSEAERLEKLAETLKEKNGKAGSDRTGNRRTYQIPSDIRKRKQIRRILQ